MSIHDNLRHMKQEQREQLAAEEKAGVDMIGGLQGGSLSVFGDGIEIRTSDYLKQAKNWVYGCVNAIAEEIAGTNFHLRKENKNGDVEEVLDSPILDLLYRANNVMTKFDLIKLTFQFLELTGECPWFLIFKGSKPVGIIPLRPERLSIIPGKDGELVAGYKYRVYGTSGMTDIKLETYEVVPLRYIDPDSPLRGKGPLQAIQETVITDQYSERYNKKFFQNSAVPSAVLSTDKAIAKDTRKRLETQLRQKYEGVDNSNKTMILESGLKFETISPSNKEMDFIELRKFSRDMILAIFRVPRTILGITDDVNRANAEASDYVFAKRTIKPKLEGFVAQLNEFVVPLFDDTGTLYIDYDDPVPENIDQKIQLAGGVGAGYRTVNEARELFGLDPVEGGDELRDPLAFNPIQNSAGVAITGKKKSDKKKMPTAQIHSKHARTRRKKEVEAAVEIVKNTVLDKVVPIIYNQLKKKADIENSKKRAKALKVARKIFTGTDEEVKAKKIAFQAEQLRVGERFEKDFIKLMDSIFAEQQEIVIQQIKEGATHIQLDVEDTKKKYERLAPLMQEVIRKQSRAAFQLVGQDNELLPTKARNSKVAQYLKSHPIRLAEQITTHTNILLGRQLAEGVEKEESIPEIAKRVTELFTGMEEYRSDRIARTEVIRATNFATEEAYVVSDVVEAKEWLAFLDSDTDEDCADLDGDVVELNANFRGGISYPPLHPNCRCTLIPVVK